MVLLPSYAPGEFHGWHSADIHPLANTRWDLFGRTGGFGTVQLVPEQGGGDPDGCTSWPPATVHGAAPGWRTAFEAGVATPVRLDSIEAMSSADSSRLTIEITRLASSTHGPDDSLFSTIPFVVRNAYRFQTADIEGVVALVQRSIHSEANPREEHLFLVMERPVGSTNSYKLGYITRAAGSEWETPLTDVLAMVTLTATHRLVLIASREFADEGEIWWIERLGPDRWRSTWRSAAAGCS